MSDRRSFSEIRAELLAEHGVDARVDRIWERLAHEVAPRTRQRRAFSVSAGVLSLAVTFACGIFVGTRFSTREPSPVAALAAEPAGAPQPAAPAAQPKAPSSRAVAEVPRDRPSRRALTSRTTDSIVASPLAVPGPEPVARTGAPEWQRLADEGEYARALEVLEANGGFEATLHDASADQLMALVDVARATGQRERAIVALRRVVSEHESDPNAPVAAWMLGSELAKASDPAAAEQAFAMYRALSPNGDFAEDALARQIDMAALQGSLEHARKLAEQYLKEFPDGPRSADIQARVEQWGHLPSPGRPEEGPAAAAPDAGVRH